MQWYNVLGGLGGVGNIILAHVLHEINDAHDIQHFLLSSKSTSEVMNDPLFKWSIAHALSRIFTLQSKSIRNTDFVCSSIGEFFFTNSALL